MNKDKESLVMFENRTWFYAAATGPVQLPFGMRHIDSSFCWCDPLLELDDDGKPTVLHRHVTWN
jgi:hypothetical protein